MIDIELPTHFYLGKEYDLAARAVLPDQPLLYESRNLTTHGVVVGMTGSGKTGLGVALLEEAAIDGIPCIIIDLKGDLTNLLLTFPELRPEDFAPWIDPDEARRQKLTPEQLAQQTAERWRQGIAEWHSTDQFPDGTGRIRLFKDSSEFRIYTPGSEAARPLSVLQSFAAPRGNVSREALTEKVDATTTAILGLTGITADPLQSREHILIANLLLAAWEKGRDLDLPKLISEIQTPTQLRRVGAFDVDTFYPEQDRHKLAVALNNILASPGFANWIHGEALDLAAMVRTPEGKPRQLIFYLAHLDEAQRTFFLTLLLGEVLTWTRSQAGTSNLRALLYFDEVFGYLPPHPANPPTKQPLMTLIKQARAFGVGVLLATQNPVDLDYKALTNAGTWFVGKLQTERDKARLLEGLEGAASAQGALTDRAYLDKLISSLGSRVFLMHNVHAGRPQLFQTRQALAYLAGPLTREQVAVLARSQEPAARSQESGASSQGQPATERTCPECKTVMPGRAKFCMECGVKLHAAAPPAASPPAGPGGAKPLAAEPLRVSTAHVAPVLPAGVTQHYLQAVPVAARPGEEVKARLVYQPRILGFADVAFQDKARGQEHKRTYRLLALPPAAGQPIAWGAAETVTGALDAGPGDRPGTSWDDVPDTANDPKKLKALEKALVDFLYNQAALLVFQNKQLDLGSQPGEDREAFLQRCREAARKASEAELATLREKYRPRLEPLEAGLKASQTALQQAQASARPAESVLGMGEALLSYFWSWGSRPAAANPAAQQQVRQVQTELERRQAALQQAQAEWSEAVNQLQAKWQAKVEDVKETRLTPRKSDVKVTLFGLAWAPFWHLEGGGAYGMKLLPAYARPAPGE